ncbi:uncharacterized protein LOC114390364 [Glycine soja]|uniref:uncharacterized protein LOC114390364 n=1 Tax=Glycine soja TaxID=3848 RepID=UPI0010401B55|nr:uncharacterized protein LOC114390364 [Glycine soja]
MVSFWKLQFAMKSPLIVTSFLRTSTVYSANLHVKGRKVESKGLHSVPVSGAPVILQSGIPLPDKRTLELILDKLQKKDTYGVFADLVDPKELPDYHDVIKHPMDFATVRKKLGNESSYTTLEQFEVFKQGQKTRASVAGVTSINLAEYVPATVDKETEIVVHLNVLGTNDITNLSLFLSSFLLLPFLFML